MAIAVRGQEAKATLFRRGRQLVVLLRREVVIHSDAFARALEEFEFHPTVSKVDGEVNIWLPELALLGTGDSFEAARRDLLSEIRSYAQEFASRRDLREATNRRSHALYVTRVLVAMRKGNLPEVVFARPTRDGEPVSAATQAL